MKNKEMYIDTVHGLIAEASSKRSAWNLIRARCHMAGLEVPTFNQIILRSDKNRMTKDDFIALSVEYEIKRKALTEEHRAHREEYIEQNKKFNADDKVVLIDKETRNPLNVGTVQTNKINPKTHEVEPVVHRMHNRNASGSYVVQREGTEFILIKDL